MSIARNRLAGGTTAPLPAAESFLVLTASAQSTGGAHVWCQIHADVPGPDADERVTVDIGGGDVSFPNVPTRGEFSFDGTLAAVEGLAAALLAAAGEIRRHHAREALP